MANEWLTEDGQGINREVADFLVEKALFEKATQGDLKAIEFWLKRGLGVADSPTVDYTTLASLITDN